MKTVIGGICRNDETHWATHCMDYDNSIGKRGFYDTCAESEKAAGQAWVELNKNKRG